MATSTVADATRTNATQTSPSKPTALPQLRRDLLIEPAGADADGFIRIVVSDPVRGTYYHLQWPLSAAVMSWQEAPTIAALISMTEHRYAAGLSDSDVAALIQFLQANQLTELDEDGAWRRTAARATNGRHNMIMSLLHNYLFFRLPLMRPQAALVRALPRLAWLYTRTFWVCLALVALCGLYLSLRQWSDVQAAFADVLKLESLAVYAVVLLCLKAIHELGHGLTAVRYGCRVPSMGIAIMLATPVFYTDTSDSWRLSDRGQRLAIVFAGVAAELIVASVALLVWPFLGDGLMRHVCFAVVTSALLGTILINLNPFMRYDGYFALSDVLRVPNLQARAFEMALWRMREWLFDLGHEPPEQMPPRMATTLTVYAILTAVYRLFLYIAIVAIVYHIGPKLLGILLAVFEIAVFIALPVWRELMVWWGLRGEIAARRRLRVTMCLPVLALLALCLPWLSTVEVPAVMQARVDEPIHLSAPAMLAEIHVSNGQHVRAGQTLFVAVSEDFQNRLTKARAETRALKARLERLHASGKEAGERLTLESRHRRAVEAVDATERLIAELTIRASADGRIVDIDPELSLGAWYGTKRPLARLVSLSGVRVRGVIGDTDLARVSTGTRATFVPDDITLPKHALQFVDLAPASNGRLAEPVLAEKFGGSVTASDEKGELVLRHGSADAVFESDAPSPDQMVRGVVRLEATAISPLRLVARRIARVLVREHGF